MFGLFSDKNIDHIRVDFHSHLIPGIDDGVKSLDQALEVLKTLDAVGIEKVITTPHIASEFYQNDEAIIKKGLHQVSKALLDENISLQLEAAAEYYVDGVFFQDIKNGKELLTFGDRFVLIETPFINKPHFFEQVIFTITSAGYKPVFAHPERYEYVQQDPGYLPALKNMGVYFQVTASSFLGYYSTNAKKIAELMLKNNLIDFIGSDIHHMKHCEAYIKFRKSKTYRRCLQLNLLNNHL